MWCKSKAKPRLHWQEAVCELLRIKRDQYNTRECVDVLRKGGYVQKFVPVHTLAVLGCLSLRCSFHEVLGRVQGLCCMATMYDAEKTLDNSVSVGNIHIALYNHA